MESLQYLRMGDEAFEQVMGAVDVDHPVLTFCRDAVVLLDQLRPEHHSRERAERLDVEKVLRGLPGHMPINI
jgi:hypothetical protein